MPYVVSAFVALMFIIMRLFFIRARLFFFGRDIEHLPEDTSPATTGISNREARAPQKDSQQTTGSPPCASLPDRRDERKKSNGASLKEQAVMSFRFFDAAAHNCPSPHMAPSARSGTPPRTRSHALQARPNPLQQSAAYEREWELRKNLQPNYSWARSTAHYQSD